jgi:tetratricopeptide (TPR) repeat protein
MENLYEVLGLTDDATEDEIRREFRTLAKKYHPDTSDADPEMFRRISHAYKVLSNEESRKDYDRTVRNFNDHTGSMESYINEYNVSADQALKMLKDLVRQTNLVKVRLKYNGRKVIEVPLGPAALATAAGFILSPIGMLLVNVGINSMFQMELVNPISDMYEKAAAAHQEGKLAEAEEAYRKTIDMSEFFVPAYINLGMLYRQLGENRKATEAFRKALEIAPFGDIGAVARENLDALRGY